MLIIKPYGFSKTEQDISDGRVRKLKKPTGLEKLNELRQEPKFIMQQWIAVIDKIATKPKTDKSKTDKPKTGKPTAEQRTLRNTLGKGGVGVFTS